MSYKEAEWEEVKDELHNVEDQKQEEEEETKEQWDTLTGTTKKQEFRRIDPLTPLFSENL